jgi:alpha-glucosidase (family GH31 glycosyl hydrolase)
MRTMFMEFPDDPATFDMQTQYMLGSALLVRPVMDEGAQSAVVYLPGSEPWYHFYNLEAVKGGQYITVKTPLDVLPVYIKGGTIH